MSAPSQLRNAPSDATQELIAKGKKYFVPNYKQREMILSHAKGARVWDLDGNDYIDLGTGIAVTSFGHCDDDLIAALTAQAHKIWHTSNVYYTEPPIRLAEELVEASGFAKRAFFCNSGAEANEAAIKLARKYSSEKYPADKREIITFHGSFHGRTLATVTATAQPKYQQGFEPLPGGFTYAKFNDFEEIERLVSDKTCAIMVEPVQGEGGITPAAPGFLAHLRQLCDKVDALLICDEIQCGMGRTGKLFCHQHSGITPDVLTLAKALGGGFPIGAMLTSPKVAEVLQFGSHGTTFGGNPMGCEVARVILHKLSQPSLMQNVEKQGDAIRARLQSIGEEFGLFKEIRGKGLMIGAEVNEPFHNKVADMMETARLFGVLILQAGPNVVRMLPPLTLTDEEREEGMNRLHQALRHYIGTMEKAA